MAESEVIVLRKTPWRETSLIVASLGAECGRMDFVMRGAKRLDNKHFPAVDLFRVLHVEYADGKHGLRPLRRLELVRDHDQLAARPESYFEACRIAAFVLRHAQEELPAPRLYRAMVTACAAMSAAGAPSAPASDPGPGWFALVRLVFLAEHGLLPDEGHLPARAGRILAPLLATAEAGAAPPQVKAGYWDTFRQWLDAYCHYHELK